jgi:hypothetical protein
MQAAAIVKSAKKGKYYAARMQNNASGSEDARKVMIESAACGKFFHRLLFCLHI